MTDFTKICVDIIRNIPRGSVASYGEIARRAGNPRSARQVARILHSMSQKYDLPWHRVINSKGQVSVKGNLYALQIELLKGEGVIIDDKGKIDLNKFSY